MRTSAGIGRHFEYDAANAAARAVVVASAWRALRAGLAAVVVAGVTAFGFAAVDASHVRSCSEERDAVGFGKNAAFFAFEHPEAQDAFLYRVVQESDGFRVRVVGRRGAFVGESWERDQDGVTRHVGDVCGDRSLLARDP